MRNPYPQRYTLSTKLVRISPGSANKGGILMLKCMHRSQISNMSKYVFNFNIKILMFLGLFLGSAISGHFWKPNVPWIFYEMFKNKIK